MTDSEKDAFFDTVSFNDASTGDDDLVIDVASTSTLLKKTGVDEISLRDDTFVEPQGASFHISSISLLKTILGAGIKLCGISVLIILLGLLAMPAAMASVGWVFGSLFIFFSAGLALFGLVLLSKCAEHLGRGSSISAIAKETYPRMAKLIDVALALKCFGVAASYLIVIGDMLPSIMIAFDVNSDIMRSRNFWVVASMLVVGPLAFLRNLDSLKYTSLAGLGAVIYMVGISILNWYKQIDLYLPPGMEPVPFSSFNKEAIKNFSIFIFAFTAHQNICTIQNEAALNTSRFMRRVINWSVGLSAVAYFLFSIFSYATYGSSTESNVFLNFPAFRPEMIFGRILYTLLSAFSYPLLTHPCRVSVLNLLPLSDEMKLRHFGLIHRLVTSGIVVGTLILALMLRNLGLVSALIGTFIGIPVCYIVPGLFYTKMFQNGQGSSRQSAVAMMLFGVTAMVVSIISLFI